MFKISITRLFIIKMTKTVIVFRIFFKTKIHSMNTHLNLLTFYFIKPINFKPKNASFWVGPKLSCAPKIFGPSNVPVLKSEKWVDIDYGWCHRNYSLLHTWKGFTDCQKIPILLCNFHWIQQCVLDDFFMLQKSYSQTGVRIFSFLNSRIDGKISRCASKILKTDLGG